jgi:hypothetical protein
LGTPLSTSSSLLGVSTLTVFPLFAAGVVDTGGKLPPVSLTPVANLLLVSTTLSVLGANLPQVLLIPVENLPPV